MNYNCIKVQQLVPVNTKEELCFVQFTHPGGEHGADSRSANRKSWNYGRHQRKFLRAKGTVMENGQLLSNQDLIFWGEWEPQSLVTRINSNAQKDFPHYIHEPELDLDAQKSIDGHLRQNTDPYVFADAFYYRCCKQIKGGKRTQLSYLKKGSIILFGSTIHQNTDEAYFGVDTVFVVGDYREYDSNNYEQQLKGFTPELYAEIVGIGKIVEDDGETALLQPVSGSCGGSCSPSSYTTVESTLRCYSGATPEQPVNGMYSFVPCKRYEGGTTGFERLIIHMKDLSKFNPNGRELITNNLNAAPKITEIEDTKAVEIWNQLCHIVKEQGLLEGVSFVCPTPCK